MPAHDSGAGYEELSAVVGAQQIDFGRPVRAFVHVATGERFRSEPTTLFG